MKKTIFNKKKMAKVKNKKERLIAKILKAMSIIQPINTFILIQRKI